MKLTKKNFVTWLESLEEEHGFTHVSDSCFFSQFIRASGFPDALVGVRYWRKEDGSFEKDYPMPEWTITCQAHFTDSDLKYFLCESSVTAKEVLNYMRGIE